MRLPIRCLYMAACMATCAVPAFAEQVDNPAYAAWAQYKPGTSVTYKSTSTVQIPNMAQPQATEMTMTQKLVAVKPEAVTVEVTITMSMNGQDHAMPPRQQEVPAKVDKDMQGVPTMRPQGGSPPEVKDMTLGKESVAVKGKTVEAVTRSFTVEMKEPQPMTMKEKVWSTPDVPGGMVKVESHGTGAVTMDSTTTLVDYQLVK